MRTLGLAVLTLAACSTVRTRPMKPADLMGHWVEVGDSSRSRVEFHTDFTFILTGTAPRPKDNVPPWVLVSDQVMKVTGGWRLAGDTVLVTPTRGATLTPVGWQYMTPPPGDALRRRVRLEGKRLIVTSEAPGAQPRVFERD